MEVRLETGSLLRNEAVNLNHLLSEYVEIHNRIFYESATFKSFFKRVDFEELYQLTLELNNNFESYKKKLIEVRDILESSAPKDHKKYFNQFVTYFTKLLFTVQCLKERQYLLYRKSEGEKINLKEYQEKERLYKESTIEYIAEGEKLNKSKYLIY